MSIKMGTHALLSAASFVPVVCALADNAAAANKSNNPLNLAPGANLQDYYTPQLFDSNALDLRPEKRHLLHPTRCGWRQSMEIRFQYPQRPHRTAMDG
jgi:hypothetical protein